MSKTIILIAVGDSISAHTAPYFDLVGVNDTGVPGANYTDIRWHCPIHIDPGISHSALHDTNRLPFARTGTNPPMTVVNAAIPGTRLYSIDDLLTSGEPYAPVAIDPLIRPSRPGTQARLYIVSMFYSNSSDVVATDAVARVVNWFNARKAAAASAGAELYCMTMTIPSRTDGLFDEVTYRVAYNNIIIDPTWQATNGIYTADLTGIASLSAVNAANNTTNFPDHIHPTFACMSQATPVVRSTVNTIIAAHP